MNDLDPEEIRITEEPYDGSAAQVLVPDYVAEIRAMYPDWTPDVPPRLTPEDVEPPAGRWVVAYLRAEPVGCAALKRLDDHTAEIKRVYVAPEARGKGVARAILARLEQIAQDVGYTRLRMDTGARQPASVALFSSSGYERIADYNGNPVAAYWFEKRLAMTSTPEHRVTIRIAAQRDTVAIAPLLGQLGLPDRCRRAGRAARAADRAPRRAGARRRARRRGRGRRRLPADRRCSSGPIRSAGSPRWSSTTATGAAAWRTRYSTRSRSRRSSKAASGSR